MDWMHIIISSLSGIVGAAVGGFATYLTMAKQFKFMAEQEIQKQKRDDELYLKRKREETYVEILELFYLLNEEKNVGNQLTTKIEEKITEKYQKIWSKINLWATKETKTKFDSAVKNVSNSEEFFAHIRKELGIKD